MPSSCITPEVIVSSSDQRATLLATPEPPTPDKTDSILLYENLNAYKMSKQVCYLPVNTDLNMSDVKRICEEVNNYKIDRRI